MKQIFISLNIFFCILNSNKVFSQSIDSSVIEYTNKLGVTAIISIPYWNYSRNTTLLTESLTDKICSSILSDLDCFNFVLKLKDSAYVNIPLRSFKEVSIKDRIHLVTLNNGTTLSGKLIGKIKSNDGKIYDLPSTINIKLVHLSKKDEKTQIKQPDKLWDMVPFKTNPTKYIIAEPKFTFAYNDTEKEIIDFLRYVDKTVTRIKTTKSFIIKIGNEEITTNLFDFKKISLKPNSNYTDKIEITSQSGVTSTGSLILKYEKKNNIGWALVLRLPEMGDAVMVLIEPNISFTQRDVN